METPPHPYIYMAKLVRVIDGDTIVVDIDLGLKQWSHSVHLRIKDLWAPEARTRDLEEKERGLAAKAYLEEMLKDEHRLKVRTYKHSFNRYVADVWFADADGEHSVTTRMIEAGHGTAEKPD